ncbi:MAG: outer membrane beta-barrel protein [Candidatus Acidiferrales bacterium]|jgi:opacity protein-like surface antigen
MKKLLGLLALLALASVAGRPAMAQDNDSRVDVGGGYAYRSWGLPGNRINMNGWNATASFDFNHWLTLAGDFDGTYSDQGSNGSGWLESYLFGPRVYPLGHHKMSPFVHALFGGAHTAINFPAIGGSEGSPAFTESDSAFAYEIGGGLDVNLSSRFAIRLGEFDFEQTRLFNGVGLPTQDNFKVKAGILIRF